VRVIQIDNEPWFVAADVCRCLGMPFGYGSGSTGQYLGRLAADEKRTVRRSSGGEFSTLFSDTRSPAITLISESGLYKLILRSSKPEARQFQDWVTREVLPSIRKVGVYHAGQEKVASGEKSLEQFAQEMLSNNNRLIEMLKAKIEEQGKDCGSGIDVAKSA
jgi:prophage antirepressor-like protein